MRKTLAQPPIPVFGSYPGCPNPPQIPIFTTIDDKFLADLGIVESPLSVAIVENLFRVSGFDTFLHQLPDRLDFLLNTINQRGGASGALTSATLALRDSPTDVTSLVRAAKLIKAAWELHAEIASGHFAPDELNGCQLEMRQYANCFATCVPYDGNGFAPFRCMDVSRIAVVAHGHVHIVEFGMQYKQTSVNDLEAVLAEIWQLGTGDLSKDGRMNGEESVGAITSLEDRSQRTFFGKLLKDCRNVGTLTAICNTFLTVCLDLAESPSSISAAFREAYSGHPSNRWFHSALQIVIFGNARCCLIFNFNAHIDGNVMMRVAAEMHRRSNHYSCAEITSECAAIKPLAYRLHWYVPEDALVDLDAEIAALRDDEESTFTLAGCGRVHFAKKGVKAVPAFHCGLQLAACRLFGRPVRISEMLSRSRYRYMEVASALIATQEIDELLSRWKSTELDDVARQRLIRLASESYQAVCREVRSRLQPRETIQLFRLSLLESQRREFDALTHTAMGILREKGLLGRSQRPEIIVSHPGLFSDVPFVGRPGVKTRHIDCFAMHYQIGESQTTVTLIRSTRCTISCSKIALEIGACVEEIVECFPDAVQRPAHHDE